MAAWCGSAWRSRISWTAAWTTPRSAPTWQRWALCSWWPACSAVLRLLLYLRLGNSALLPGPPGQVGLFYTSKLLQPM